MAIARTTKFFPPQASLTTAVRGRALPRGRITLRTRRRSVLLARAQGWRFAVGSWVVGLAATMFVAWDPQVALLHPTPSLHPVLDAVQASVAVVAAGVVYMRFERLRAVQDLLVAQGLILVAAGGFIMAYVAERPVEVLTAETVDVWTSMCLRILGIALVAMGAMFAGRTVPRSMPRALGVAIPATAIALVAIVVWISRTPMSTAADGAGDAVASLAFDYPLLGLAHGAAAVGLSVAAVAFAKQYARNRAPLAHWLAAACALAACAQLNFAIVPTLFTSWLHAGNILGAASYGVLLLGVAGEFRRASNAHVHAAVHDDRLRLAREIHDGVIQEIAYIRSEVQSIGADPGVRKHIVGACDRALDEARSAVMALGGSTDEPLEVSLFRTCSELADRYDFDLTTDLAVGVDAGVEQRHALMRIAREAIANAIHHGHADSVHVRMTPSDVQRELVIVDNGSGFDPVTVTSRGYGLISMRDRARALPGLLTVTSELGRGSTVRVQW